MKIVYFTVPDVNTLEHHLVSVYLKTSRGADCIFKIVNIEVMKKMLPVLFRQLNYIESL